MTKKNTDIINKTLLDIYNKNFKDTFKNDVNEFKTNSWEDELFLKDPDFTNLSDKLKNMYELNLTNKDNISHLNKLLEFKDVKRLSYYDLLKENKLFLAFFLYSRIEKKQSIHSLYSDLSFLSKIYTIINNTINSDISTFISNKYKKLLLDFKKIIIDNLDGGNILNSYEKDKFIKYEDILDIFNKIDENKDYKNHILKLLLGLYTLTPPLRGEALDFKFLTDIKKNDGKSDYIYLSENDNNIYFIFNKPIKGNPPIKYMINNNKLINLIKESYKKYPREWVISSVYDKDANIKMQMKKNYFKLINPNISINNLRSAYFTYWIDNLSHSDLKIACRKSRTSIMNVNEYYYKNLNPSENKKINEFNL